MVRLQNVPPGGIFVLLKRRRPVISGKDLARRLVLTRRCKPFSTIARRGSEAFLSERPEQPGIGMRLFSPASRMQAWILRPQGGPGSAGARPDRKPRVFPSLHEVIRLVPTSQGRSYVIRREPVAPRLGSNRINATRRVSIVPSNRFAPGNSPFRTPCRPCRRLRQPWESPATRTSVEKVTCAWLYPSFWCPQRWGSP